MSSFPHTRLTLVRRIANGGSEEDWQQFLEDYWGPICRFAARRAGLSREDAEDVASNTIEIVLRNGLLARWQAQPSAKLRTLLCSVVRNVLANRMRVQSGRKRLLKKHLEQGPCDAFLLAHKTAETTDEQADLFYTAWVQEMLQQCIEALVTHYHRCGKGDCFRVLYGRLCEDMTTAEIATTLGIPTQTAEGHYKAAKRRLADELKSRVRQHVERYCDPQQMGSEFRDEWRQLADFLKRQGGLEQTVRRGYLENWLQEPSPRQSDSFLTTVSMLRSVLRESHIPDARPPAPGNGS
jgi:RNA polymerase sigma factor (sigma-70 family)